MHTYGVPFGTKQPELFLAQFLEKRMEISSSLSSASPVDIVFSGPESRRFLQGPEKDYPEARVSIHLQTYMFWLVEAGSAGSSRNALGCGFAG